LSIVVETSHIIYGLDLMKECMHFGFQFMSVITNLQNIIYHNGISTVEGTYRINAHVFLPRKVVDGTGFWIGSTKINVTLAWILIVVSIKSDVQV